MLAALHAAGPPYAALQSAHVAGVETVEKLQKPVVFR